MADRGIKPLFNKILSGLNPREEYYGFPLGEENEHEKVIGLLYYFANKKPI